MFSGLLDTDADVSGIDADCWLGTWPKQATMTQLQGMGQSQISEQSNDLLNWEDLEGHKGNFSHLLLLDCLSIYGEGILRKKWVLCYLTLMM